MSTLQNNIEQSYASEPLASLQLPYVTAPSQTYPKQSLRCPPVFEMPFGSMSTHILWTVPDACPTRSDKLNLPIQNYQKPYRYVH